MVETVDVPGFRVRAPTLSVEAAVAFPTNQSVPPERVMPAALLTRSALFAALLSSLSVPSALTVMPVVLDSAPAAPDRTTAPPWLLIVVAPRYVAAPVIARAPRPDLARIAPAAAAFDPSTIGAEMTSSGVTVVALFANGLTTSVRVAPEAAGLVSPRLPAPRICTDAGWV